MKSEQRRLMRERIGRALRTTLLPGATADSPGAYRRTDLPPEDMLARFTAELTGLGGEVHDMPGAGSADVAAFVASVSRGPGDGPCRVLAWDDSHLPVAGLRAALTAHGLVVINQDETSGADRDALASCGAGVTGVDALLAETGSMAIVSGPGRGRLASLLPPVHVAIARRTQLIHSLPDLLIEKPELVTAGSNFVCITGPSRTADIEHTLSRGVHGPAVVHVVVI